MFMFLNVKREKRLSKKTTRREKLCGRPHSNYKKPNLILISLFKKKSSIEVIFVFKYMRKIDHDL